jgi:HEAT repeat protein
MLRQTARRSLVAVGEPAVGALVGALNDKKAYIRWEAAKALGEIGSPKAAPALVRALEDGGFGVRWLAAEGLIALGREGLPPLLQALIERPDSTWLRDGAHHVLRVLADRGLHDLVAPAVVALDSLDPELDIVTEAHSVLEALGREERDEQRNRRR